MNITAHSILPTCNAIPYHRKCHFALDLTKLFTQIEIVLNLIYSSRERTKAPTNRHGRRQRQRKKIDLRSQHRTCEHHPKKKKQPYNLILGKNMESVFSLRTFPNMPKSALHMCILGLAKSKLPLRKPWPTVGTHLECRTGTLHMVCYTASRLVLH